MSGAAEDRYLGPVSGKMQAVTVGVAALGATALTTPPTNGGPGPGYYSCEATGGDIAIVFGSTTTALGGTNPVGVPALSGTSKNSETIPAGTTKGWWLTSQETHFNAIASVAACTLTIRRSSP